MSLRLYNELEVVQKKKSQLEWENEVLRERTQELDVAKQVLQGEVDKFREVRRFQSRSVCVCVCGAECFHLSSMESSPSKLHPSLPVVAPITPDGHVTHDPGADQ